MFLVCLLLCEILKLLFTHLYHSFSTLKKVLFFFVKEILSWTFSLLENVRLFIVVFFVQSLVEAISIEINTDVNHFFLLFGLLHSHFISFASLYQSRVVED